VCWSHKHDFFIDIQAFDRKSHNNLSKNSVHRLPSSTKNVISDPCLTVNKVEHVTYGGQQFDLKGTGNYLLCQQSLVPLLNKSVTCQKQPCSMNGVYQPEIKFQRSTFFGFSEFYYSSEDVLRLGGAYHYETFERAAKVSTIICSCML